MSDKWAWPNDGKDHYGQPNPQYDPEACGLVLLATVGDKNSCYSFDDCVLWRDVASGKYYMGADSGCSCPTPFEDFHSLADLTEVDSETGIRAFIRTHSDEKNQYPKRDLRDIDAMIVAFLKDRSGVRDA